MLNEKENKKVWPADIEGFLLELVDGDRSMMEDIGRDCAAGWPQLSYYSDTCAFHDQYESEIWDMLEGDADDFGYKNVLELIASFGWADNVGSMDQLKNLLCWYACERTAHRLADDDSFWEAEEDEEDEEDEEESDLYWTADQFYSTLDGMAKHFESIKAATKPDTRTDAEKAADVLDREG